jgi:hypothetical protein
MKLKGEAMKKPDKIFCFNNGKLTYIEVDGVKLTVAEYDELYPRSDEEKVQNLRDIEVIEECKAEQFFSTRRK